MFKQLVLMELGLALAAGLVLSALQSWQVIPIIYAAEEYEITTPVAAATLSEDHSDEHTHDSWSPNEGKERIGSTVLSNILATFGLALITLAAMTWSREKLHQKLGWERGLLWGASGYLALFVIPSLGLPPEIPGMEAAVLEGRQSWWLLAVICSISGLATLAFVKGNLKMAALVLLALPWVVGAPQPEIHGFGHPDATAVAALNQLAADFVTATLVANGIFWLLLGGMAGWLLQRFPLTQS